METELNMVESVESSATNNDDIQVLVAEAETEDQKCIVIIAEYIYIRVGKSRILRYFCL